jgi:adenosylhomocysteinase
MSSTQQDMRGESTLRNPDLAPEGVRKIEWVGKRMPILGAVREEEGPKQPLAGKRVAVCLHLEAKTAYMATVLRDLGAEVTLCGSNPLSTQDDVAAGLASLGVRVHSWYGATGEEYTTFLDRVLDSKPQLIIDDGGDLVERIHTERRESLEQILGGAEETTTGIHRLRAMETTGQLGFPMFAVNDAYCKHLFDNRYGTGQSVWDGIMRTTNLVVSGKRAVVIGYGWCGKGVAMRAAGLGAKVTVCEVDPIKAAEAWMDGFHVESMTEAAKTGDFFITVTGCNNAIRREHLERMKDGAILANAGHFDVEISKSDLKALAEEVQEVRTNIRGYRMADGRTVYLLADGRLVNLAAADGHPAEIMDMSFAVQALAGRYTAEHRDALQPAVLRVPEEIDDRIARYKLQAMNIAIDELSAEQRAYIEGYEK